MVIRLIYEAGYFDSMNDAAYLSVFDTTGEKRKKRSWEAFIAAMQDDAAGQVNGPQPHTKPNPKGALVFAIA